jgi:hypothetical protein
VSFDATAGAAESPSEKMVSFCRPLFVVPPPTPELGRGACGSLGAAAAKGSIFAANAGRTVGRAGEDGSLESSGL